MVFVIICIFLDVFFFFFLVHLKCLLPRMIAPSEKTPELIVSLNFFTRNVKQERGQ